MDVKKITYLPKSVTASKASTAPVNRLIEVKRYDRASRNPMTKDNNVGYGKNKPFLGKNGFDKPLNSMAAPYGAYSLVRKAASNGSIAVNDLID